MFLTNYELFSIIQSSINKILAPNDFKTESSIFDDYHISTKQEYRTFLKNYHPDKSNDISVSECAKIIEQGKKMGW